MDTLILPCEFRYCVKCGNTLRYTLDLTYLTTIFNCRNCQPKIIKINEDKMEIISNEPEDDSPVIELRNRIYLERKEANIPSLFWMLPNRLELVQHHLPTSEALNKFITNHEPEIDRIIIEMKKRQ